ncbi:cell wall-binding repeat-containing protein [Pedococcus aerophilus]|uniref:cell wall-binding repeat-containing protein n=1 Tax=Pedococcus aerophilus TaxID=436356 RepID=UPI0031E3B334
MSPASSMRRARTTSACAAAVVVAVLATPGSAVAAQGGDPDSRERIGTAAGTTTDGAGAAAFAARTTDRIAGADRYATAVAASRAAFPSANPAGLTTVYLASGTGYADALAAGPAAVASSGTLLLTQSNKLTAATASELRRLAPDRVVVVGGPGAVAGKVLDDVRAIGLPASRVSGTDRYATADAVARQAFPAGARTAWVTTGRGYADALAAGPAAGAAGGPVVLVDGNARGLSGATRRLLTDLGVTTVRIAGGTGAVSSGIQADLTGLVGSGSVTRSAGSDRYRTAIAVSHLAFPSLTKGDTYVATGTGFADALAVGVLAGRSKRPLYLSTPYCATTTVRTELSRGVFGRLRLVGGPGAIRGLVGTLTPCQSISSASSPWVVVNKKRPLSPLRYAPSPLVGPSLPNINGQLLRSDAAAALADLAAGSRSAGAGRLAMLSGYRSYSYQSSVYSAKVASSGVAEADKWVARPGHSEHQTGLGTDVSPIGAANCSSYTCIGSTPQGRWIAANAWRYGFVVRYESGRTSTTGYSPEPWHLRYVGKPLAQDYHSGGWHTLEDYFDLPDAPRY